MGQPTAWPVGADRAAVPGDGSTPDPVPGSGQAADRRTGTRPGAPGQGAGPGERGGPGAQARRIRRPGTLSGLRAGQVVATELAVVALVAAAAGGGRWLAVGVPAALITLFVTFGRIQGHRAYGWLAMRACCPVRRRELPPGGDSAALLGLVRPAAVVNSVDVDSAAVGVIEDAYGLSAVLELGDPTALLSDAAQLAPSPAELLPPASADQPQLRLQLLVSGFPAPALSAATGSPATSYRQLTEGRVLALQRSFLTVHVRRSGGFTEAELRRALSSAVRRTRRRFERDGLPCRPLSPEATLRVLGELAHLDGADGLREDWSAVSAGGLRQVSVRLDRWPDLKGDLGRSLLTRLLALPGAATTVSLAAERLGADEVRVELVARLASPDPQSQAVALGGLHRLVGAAGARSRRLDGTQLAGLAATLPFGGSADPGVAALADVLDRSAGAALVGDAGLRAGIGALAALELPTGGAGLMMGVNRSGEPTTIGLFRPEPTRVALFGGARYAQLMALRALALGAQVVVQTGRPHAWEPFARGVSGSGDALTVAPANRPLDLGPPTPLRPQLVIVDVGPVGAMNVPVPEAAWRAVLVLRDELATPDVDVLARADLVVLPPLSAPEAEIAGYALGLDQLAGNLPRIHPDMVGVVADRRTLRWTLLSVTPIEQQLIGAISR
jgi:type VII secretion protein EccE